MDYGKISRGPTLKVNSEISMRDEDAELTIFWGQHLPIVIQILSSLLSSLVSTLSLYCLSSLCLGRTTEAVLRLC